MHAFQWSGNLRIPQLRLRTARLEPLLAFYEHALGLEILTKSGSEAALAAPGQNEPLVILSEDAGAVRRPTGSTGLFHLALRLPSRVGLANALRRLLRYQDALVGAEHHGVSEALYLRDPDGNGVELYADLPRSQWPWHEGQIAMTSASLDLANLLAATDAPSARTASPQGIELGHLHLHVAELAEAERFFHKFLGLAVTQRDFPGALFFAAGGYHHHIAANTWAGGARTPPAGSTGLISYRLETSRQESVEVLRQRALAFGYETGAAGPGFLEVRDPNGAWLEVAAASVVPIEPEPELFTA